MKEYNLRITERQAKRIMFALDLYTRLSVGQMNLLNEITFEKDNEGLKVQAKRETLTLLQKEMFPTLVGLNNSYGIHSRNLPDEIRESYDIFKVMMYEFNKNKGAMNVYADQVRQASKQLLPLFNKLDAKGRKEE